MIFEQYEHDNGRAYVWVSKAGRGWRKHAVQDAGRLPRLFGSDGRPVYVWRDIVYRYWARVAGQ